MERIEQKLKAQLAGRRQSDALRTLPSKNSLIDFCSNDYLGLARRSATWPAASHGSTGSRLISGNSRLAEDLEAGLAAFHRAPAALLYPSGYTANLGLLAAAADRHDSIFYDRLVHASIRDALQLTRARSFAFRHNDPEDLQRKLRHSRGNRFIVVESIYSMDGDEAPLPELAEIAESCGAGLIVDEAHSTGIFGPAGAGLVVEQGLEERVWARVHTFGKAIGSHGAAVLGPGYLRDYLINYSRPFIYTTALPPATLLSIRRGYDALQEGTARRALQRNIRRFRDSLSEAARCRFIDSRGPIQALLWPGNREASSLAAALQNAGFDLRAILPPTIPRGQERIRICLHAYNTFAEIDALAQLINQIVSNYE